MASVGQVEFQVKADGLDTTLSKAGQLEKILNNIDGRTVTPSVTRSVRALRQATQKADSHEVRRHKLLREQANLEKKIALQQRKRMLEESKAAAKFKKDISTGLVERGERLQSLGNALQNISAPFTNIYRGLTMGIGYRLLGKVTESISGAFERYDTMQTYDKVLKQIGLDASKKFAIGTDKAKSAIDNLNDAVVGLPTGLDEIVAAMRKYAGATGDIERATKLAIAANNAYIAGHMDDRQKLFTERQLQSLAGGAELSENQWDSLRRNAPLAMRTVAKAMKMNVQDMVDSLKKGKISGQEFLDAFIKVGTEGKIQRAAQVMKNTWDAVSQNFQNAMNRMGEGILKTLDSVFEKMDGRTFLQHVLGTDKDGKYIGGGIKGVIDDMSQSVQEWIKANPEKITNFFNNFSKVDWKGIIGGFAEFTLTMGRFYAWAAKFVGNGNLVKGMLYSNLLGKALTIGGGALKGSAGFFAWLATLKKFHGMGRAVKNGAELAKSHGAIVGAARTMAQTALTWQSVASKAVSVAAIPAMGWAFKEIAIGLQELTKVDMSKLTPAKFGAIAVAIGELGTIATVIGHLTASNAFGWVSAAGMAIGTAEIAGIAKTMKWVGEGLNAIADAKLPETGKITSIMKKMDEISKHFESRNIFESIGKIFDAWTKSAEFKSVKSATDAFKGIGDMVSMKLPKGWRKRSTNRFKKVLEFVTDIEAEVVLLDEKLLAKSQAAQEKYGTQKGTSKAKKTGNSYAYIKEQMRSFADLMQSISDGMGYLDTALLNVKKFNKDYAQLSKLKDGTIQQFDWDILFYRIRAFAEQIYKFVQPVEGEKESTFQMLTKAAEQLKGAEFSQISSLFETLPNIIGGLEKTYNRLLKSPFYEESGLKIQAAGHKSPLSDLTSNLKPLFDAINTLNGEIPEDLSGLKKLKAIQKSLSRIPTVISQIVDTMNNTQVGQINIATIQGVVAKIKEALSQFDALKDSSVNIKLSIKGSIDDAASDEIKKAYDKIEKAIDKIDDLSGTKTVKVHVNAVVTGVTAAIQAINDAIAKIRDAIGRLSSAKASAYNSGRPSGSAGGHVVAHNGGRIHPLYRAQGGSIFNSRGTDTVPAMLTPGEFVLNRMAASRLGGNALWKLNHLDIAGAIRDLSVKAGQSIIPRNSVINNTTNNIKNIGGVNIHNDASAGVGLGRANRWVNAL